MAVSAVYNTAFAHGIVTSFSVPTSQIWSSTGTGGGTLSVSSSINRRTGGFSLDINKTSSSSTTVFCYKNLTAANKWAVRFYVYFQSLPASTTRIFTIEDSVLSNHFKMSVTSNKLAVGFTAGGADTASTTTITTGVWYRVDLQIDVSANQFSCNWQIDGVAQTSSTPTFTAGTLDRLVFGVSSNSTTTLRFNFTDVILSNTLGDYPIGPGLGYYALPTSMGTHVNSGRFQNGDGTAVGSGTPALLADWPPIATGGNTDYLKQVTADGVGESSYIEIKNVQEASLAVFNAVTAYLAYTSNTTASNNGGCVVRRTDGTEITVFGSDSSLADYSDGSITSWRFSQALVTAPSGGWTQAELNALLFRCGYATDVTPNPYWGALLIEYDAVIPPPPIKTIRTAVGRAANW